jgi:hypothetical protein
VVTATGLGTVARSSVCEYVQSDTTIFASNITGGIKQLHVSTLYVGHLQVVIRLSDQLCRNAWSALGEFWGRGGGSRSRYNGGCHGPGLFTGGILLVVIVPFSRRVLLLS